MPNFIISEDGRVYFPTDSVSRQAAFPHLLRCWTASPVYQAPLRASRWRQVPLSAHQQRCGGRFIRPIPWYPPSRNRRYGVFLAVCAGVHSTTSPQSTSKRFLLFVMSSPHIPLFLGAEVVLAADKLRSIDVPWSMSLANSWRGVFIAAFTCSQGNIRSLFSKFLLPMQLQ